MYLRSLCLASLLIAGTVGSFGFQEAAGIPKPGGKSRVRTELRPMFVIVKSMGFTVAEMPKSRYTFSRGEVATMPAGSIGNKAAQDMVYITYARKGGGLVRLYETKSVPGLKRGELAKKIAASHVFHDSYGDPSFVSAELTVKGVQVVITSLRQDLLGDAIRYLPVQNEAPAR